MKKVLLIMVAVLGMAFAANAQDNLGVRLGTGSYGHGAELSWQHALGDNNRLELDLGFNGLFNNTNAYQFINLTGVYQWHWYIADKFGWYVGPGATIGIFPDADKSFGIAVGGQIGIDYELPIPLQLSLDARPMWNFLGAYNGFGWGACLGIRYMF
jgi:hypothetical protein